MDAHVWLIWFVGSLGNITIYRMIQLNELMMCGTWSKKAAPFDFFYIYLNPDLKGFCSQIFSLGCGRKPKHVRTMLLGQCDYPPGESLSMLKQTLHSAVLSSKHQRCQLYWWLWALNAHIWLLQLEPRLLLLRSAVAYSHILVCLLINIHSVDLQCYWVTCLWLRLCTLWCVGYAFHYAFVMPMHNVFSGWL